ncbi:MAG: extracellular solute-binding protein family 3 [Betaproteobacteria bacterium]|nr:extracellular solute-binding protein family 3 [Betaproteobacteria bacterium]
MLKMTMRCAVCFLLALTVSAPAFALQMLTEEYPPYNYTENKALIGLSTEIVVEMGKRANVPMTFAIMPWPDAYEQTQRKVETCIFSTARLVNRERIFKWVGPLASNEWGLFAKKGFADKITNLADARPYRIGGVTNDAKIMWLRDMALTNIVEVKEDKLVPGMLTLDRKKLDAVDLWVTGINAEKFIVTKNKLKDVKLVLKIKDEPMWLACHPSLSEATITSLSNALAAMRKDGAYKTIIDSYDKKFAP